MSTKNTMKQVAGYLKNKNTVSAQGVRRKEAAIRAASAWYLDIAPGSLPIIKQVACYANWRQEPNVLHFFRW